MPLQAFTDYPKAIGFLPLMAGRFYNGQHVASTGTFAVSANILYAHPIWVPNRVKLSGISLEVTTLSAGNARMGVYRDSSGAPGVLMVGTGTVSTGTTGSKAASITNLLIPGIYWLACAFDATPTVRSLPNGTGDVLSTLGFTSNTDTTFHIGVSVAFVFAAMPDPFTGGSALITSHMPRVMISI